jgi:hypothetical protein
VLTKQIMETVQDLIFGTIEDQFKRKIATTLGQWSIQLLMSNSSFFMVRFILAKFAYAAFELGRDAVFSILLTLLTASALACGALYYHADALMIEFLREYRLLVSFTLSIWTLTIWYWGRYVFRSNSNQTVFDHEIGAVLVTLKR